MPKRASAWLWSCDKKATSGRLSLKIDVLKNWTMPSTNTVWNLTYKHKVLTPTEFMAVVPMRFPMTHVVDHEILPGFAKYIVEDWELQWHQI